MEFVRQMCGLLLLLIAKRTVDGLSIIRGSRRTAIGVELTLICQDDGFITQSVNFLKNSLLQGGCSTSCGTGITGYVVSQNRTAKETYLTISSLEESRDGGDWTCKQGTDAVSSPFTINNTLPCFINAASDITVTPPVSSLSSPDNISVNVSVSCCTQTASVQWTYQKQNESPVLLASSTSTESCTGGGKKTQNTFQPQRTAFLTTGIVNLTLTIEHDSFDPPDYTVVYTTLIDLGGSSGNVPVPLWSLEIGLMVITWLC